MNFMNKDKLNTRAFKIYRLVMRNLLHVTPTRFRDRLAEALVRLWFRSYLIETRRADGRWVCLTRDEVGKILDGPDNKRFNKDNFYPVMREFVRPGSVAIDVGTSYGDEVIELSDLVGAEGRVYALEPSPAYFPALERTVALNRLDNVVCLNKAAGERSGFVGAVTASAFADSPYLKGRDAGYGDQADETTMECISLDSLADEFGDRPLSFIKVDTDGFEVEVVKGALRLLDQHPNCKLIVEFMAGTDYSGDRDADVFRLYRKLGFKVHKIQTFYQEIGEAEYDYVITNSGNPLHMIAHDIVLVPGTIAK